MTKRWEWALWALWVDIPFSVGSPFFEVGALPILERYNHNDTMRTRQSESAVEVIVIVVIVVVVVVDYTGSGDSGDCGGSVVQWLRWSAVLRLHDTYYSDIITLIVRKLCFT